jgi:hypothetical protein
MKRPTSKIFYDACRQAKPDGRRPDRDEPGRSRDGRRDPEGRVKDNALPAHARAVIIFLPLVLGPDATRRIHGIDARIAVEGYKDCARFYVHLLNNESHGVK